MRFTIALLAFCGALTTAFVQKSSPFSAQKASSDVKFTPFVNAPFAADHAPPSFSALSMAFDLKDGETSNMFDGPLPLTKERDACGVGFIANTKSGGKCSPRLATSAINPRKCRRQLFISRCKLTFHFQCTLLIAHRSFLFGCCRRVWHSQGSSARSVCP